MPVISFASPKGGAGKTTAAVLLATEIAQKDIPVTIIDCDPRQWSLKWGAPGKLPQNLKILDKPDEDSFIDLIEKEAQSTPFVFLDLEGTDSRLVAYAVSRSDLVLIPMQAGSMEAEAAADMIKFIKQQERAFRTKIPFALFFTRMSAAIRTNLEKDIVEQITSADVPVFQTQLIERVAFKEANANKCTLNDLPGDRAAAAKVNIRALAGELLALCKTLKSEQENSKGAAA